jgi:hypothetical protein
MKNSGEALPSEKDNAAVKAYFQKVYPDIDFERVYASDMKKMIKWFSVLQANNVAFKLSEATEEQTEDTEQGVEVTSPRTEDVDLEKTEH